ncbi:MAG TPA: GNAT family N-acetyltransferase [Candidatus Dormibacteraeota bacterium]|nr:GNAT family N-acetyltransferase [Candidatus Dormibacteraeota bacterium]
MSRKPLQKPQPLTILPATPDLWPAIENLFGPKGACNNCWCMYWRIGAQYRRNPPAKNKAAFKSVIREGPPPGLIAFEGQLPVGWCQLTPREDLAWLDRTWGPKTIDQTPVWSISCLYVRVGHRKKGVTAALLGTAICSAKKAKAAALEAYPLDARKSPSATGTGFASTFARAGFKIVAKPTPPRPIMRLNLSRNSR